MSVVSSPSPSMVLTQPRDPGRWLVESVRPSLLLGTGAQDPASGPLPRPVAAACGPADQGAREPGRQRPDQRGQGLATAEPAAGIFSGHRLKNPQRRVSRRDQCRAGKRGAQRLCIVQLLGQGGDRQGHHPALGPGLEAKTVHAHRRQRDGRRRCQSVCLALQRRLAGRLPVSGGLDSEELVQVVVPVRRDPPVVQAGPCRDRFAMQHVGKGRAPCHLPTLSVEREGGDRGVRLARFEMFALSRNLSEVSLPLLPLSAL